MSQRSALGMLGGALIALCASCSPKHTAAAKPKPETHAPSDASIASAAPSVGVTAAPASASCSAAHPSRLDNAAVSVLVSRWKLAQKAKDFPAYSALYAAHFSGLLADASGIGRVDRQGWLRAHEPILALDPRVATAPVRIAIGAGGAQVTFGPRGERAGERLPELFVIPTTTGPKIVREAPTRSVPSELESHPGLWLATERFAILSAKPDASWADGAPSFSGDSTATSAVALARLPKTLRAWLGRPVRVLGEGGIVCETRLQRFAIRAQISPDLATAEAWDGCADEPAQTATQIAEDIWQLSALEGRTLVAELATPCKGALLAIDPDRPAPSIAPAEPASAELGAAALAAFRALPNYAQVQARFEASNPTAEGAWDDTAARRSVWSLELAGRRSFVFVSVEAGAGCASFSASLSALWAVQGATLSLLEVPRAEDDKRLTPRAFVDFGATMGIFLGPDGAYRTQSFLTGTGDLFGQGLLTSVPFFAGPC